MRVGLKFCGLTRSADAEAASRLGAAYAGVIFAGGPRHTTPLAAGEVLDAAGSGVRRVGVFATQSVRDIADAAAMATLDIVQLHAQPSAALVTSIRAATGCAIWAVVRVAGEVMGSDVTELAGVADALLLDSHVAGRLGGSGVPFDWRNVARARAALHVPQLVVAGGLTPENVGEAIALLTPDIVDVSSGVESSPGIKDHDRMRAFAEAVRRSQPSAEQCFHE